MAQTEPLKLAITLEQPVITAPFPARVTLHLHNSGKETVWLYRHASPARSSAGQATSAAYSGTVSRVIEGPTIAVRLEAADSHAPASGELLENVGLPHPKLIRLAAGEDYEEKAAIRVSPGTTETNDAEQPIWGRYKLAVTYAAKYSNAEELRRILGATLWQGELASNVVDLELQPPAAAARGSITGTVVGADNIPRSGVLLSLSDKEERLIAQTSSDVDGKYSFAQLPFGLYWVTARYRDAEEDTTVFRHVDLTSDDAVGTINFLLAVPESYQPKQMLHKPVLFSVVDSAGAPLANAALAIVWSSGTVLDNVKARTSDDGMAAVELIPGRNYVTVKRSKCPNDEERLDVKSGPGVDGFRVVFECSRH